ncbi:MAG: type II toxin-antitoxin system prevent-host-death family antitoxin [Hyphomicrobiales bacterium]|nr:type II toxin-antitoxin system prevent-host-death family antitoxin [Hyphomicrobiales bacterium]
MGNHSVVEAKNRLSALIERALKGERVVITRHGHPVLEMKPVADPPQAPLDSNALDWIAERRAARGPLNIDAVDLVRKLRVVD